MSTPLLHVRVAVRGESARSFAFVKTDVNIGRSDDNDVVLDHPSVSDRHARVIARDDRLILVDLKSAAGTKLNEIPIVAPTIIDDTDTIAIGAYDVSILVDLPPCDATERAFLDAIAASPANDDARVVYADWLEEQGRLEAAEMVRAQLAIKDLSPDDPTFQTLARRIDELIPRLPRVWRRIIARPAIEACDLRFDLACPQRWDALEPTASPSERFCSACQKNVVYTANVHQARRLAMSGRCVAVDLPASERSPDDLAPPTLAGRIA